MFKFNFSRVLNTNLVKGCQPNIRVICAIFIHIIFAFSIFDIYFKSTIIHGITPHANPLSPPAKRLILVVIDGLRANTFDKLLKDDKNELYLRYIVEEKGILGLSRVQVPTESRTGHVRIIAGMNEDVSAVFTGWQQNPVEFDSFFNQSRYTWSWGSPDILSIFSKGTHRNHVYTDSYSSSELDFGTTNLSRADIWVFDKFKYFLRSSRLNFTLAQMLSNDKIVFFLHLVATDTIGHAKKPSSMDYENNVVLVDKQIKEMVNAVEDYFHHDNRTAYVVTSDHGMTEWGSHGSGSLDETETPIVAWGAGIRGPVYVSNSNPQTKRSFERLKPVNIDQVDIAPLMSTLIGVPFPLNSVGVLHLEFLNVSEEFHSQALFTNAKQISARCEANRELKTQTALTIFPTEFKKFPRQKQREYMQSIPNLIAQRKFNYSIGLTTEFIDISLKGIHYYDTYDRLILNCVISLGFAGWMMYLSSFILERFTDLSLVPSNDGKATNITRQVVFTLSIILMLLFLKAKNVPLQFYLYFIIPAALAVVCYDRLETYKAAAKILRKDTARHVKTVILAVIGLEILIFSLFHREVLTVGLLILSIWPWRFTSMRFKHKNICILWTLSVVGLSLFPLMPVVGKIANYNLVFLSGWLSVIIAVYCVNRPELKVFPQNITTNFSSWLIIPQGFLMLGSMYVKYKTTESLSKDQGLLRHNQILAWAILFFCFVIPFYSETSIFRRLFHISLSLIPVYLLMSTAYEGLFLLCLCVAMLSWILCEYNLKFRKTKLENVSFKGQEWKDIKLTYDDVRRAYFSLGFIFTAFFGTGNIASISSFDPESLYCFMTVFNPFAMLLLLLLKIMIPFVIVSCSFYAIIEIVQVPVWKLFCIVLLMSDFMSVHFFLFVQDFGSWLEIGSSISRYILMMVVTIILAILHFLAQLLTTKKLSCHKS